MENILLVQQYLGGIKAIGSPETELDFVPIIRKGFPVSAFIALRDRAQLSEETICDALGIARRTAARRKERAGRLNSDESELLLRLARVLAAATDVLGDKEKARSWLLAENRALDGSTPLELLDTGIGFQEVMELLGRIEHGIYS